MDGVKPQTLILISHEYPPYVFGGVAFFSRRVAEWLSESGWRVVVIAGKAGFSERVSVSKVSDRLTVVRLYFPEIPPRWLLYGKVARGYVVRLIERGYSVVLSNAPLTGLVVPRSVRSKLHVITFFHGSIYSLLSLVYYTPLSDLTKISPLELAYYSQLPLMSYLAKQDLLLSNSYVFVARHVMEEYKDIYADLAESVQSKGIIMYPGIEYTQLARLRMIVEKVDTGRIIIAFVGRLYYTKGVVHAVKAVEALLHNLNVKDAELWIFGKGPLEQWIKYYVRRKRDLRNRVKLFGFIERDKLITLLARYVDVLLHPSLYEGAPIAIMEAQALGIPVVAYDLPWAQEFIIDGVNGYKALCPDTFKLAESILKAVYVNPGKVMLVAKRYDWREVFKILGNLLREH